MELCLSLRREEYGLQTLRFRMNDKRYPRLNEPLLSAPVPDRFDIPIADGTAL